MAGKGIVHGIIFLLTILLNSKLAWECLLFNFGDSHSDTGSGLALFGSKDMDMGSLFFQRPTGRICDGRLTIDFICQNASVPFLSGYLRPFDRDFRHGVNFAVDGATATKMKDDIGFSLSFQIRHFLSFRSLTAFGLEMAYKVNIDEKGYRNAVYMFDIGANDLIKTLRIARTHDELLEIIPPVVEAIRKNIETLYWEVGAKKFWVHGTGPLGCLLGIRGGSKYPNLKVDDVGCVELPNNASKELNIQLRHIINELRATLKDCFIVYVDIYSLKYDLFPNHSKYGFKEPFIQCGRKAAECPEGSNYILWDLMHYTELSNSIVASQILSGDYSDPPIKFPKLCTA